MEQGWILFLYDVMLGVMAWTLWYVLWAIIPVIVGVVVAVFILAVQKTFGDLRILLKYPLTLLKGFLLAVRQSYKDFSSIWRKKIDEEKQKQEGRR